MAKTFDINKFMESVERKERDLQRTRKEELELLKDSFETYDKENMVRIR